ncbi:hypothetical protein GGS24DRAFT_210711 [Hypoxylon argillaceum]|nr:hypothetical protein GGS24DRAFT_210711 [Hypoxylon argillaceum]
MELDAHPMTPEPFGAYGYHMRRPQDVEIEMGGRPRHLQPALSAPSSPPSRYALARDGASSRGAGGSSGKSPGGGDGCRAVAPAPDVRSGSKSWPSSPKSHCSLLLPRKEARQLGSPPHASKAHERIEAEEEEEEEEERESQVVAPERPPPHAVVEAAAAATEPFQLPLHQKSKRTRTPDDVDGPGTAGLAVKKRRLLLHLVTSRLSRRFSLPATHILIRESSDSNMPVLHRIQQLAAAARTTPGARGYQGGSGSSSSGGGGGSSSALVRKAAILNRVRIGVRQAAVARGHTIMAELAARGNALHHGLLLVTTPVTAPAGAVGAAPVFPVVGSADGGMPRGGSVGTGFVPPVWRPHTTSFHPPISPGYQQHYYPPHPQQQQQHSHDRGIDTPNFADTRYTNTNQVLQASPHRQHNEPHAPEPVQSTPPPPAPYALPEGGGDEEDTTAFPAASFYDRYADLSDDDMDDVYADFGVLFGSGASAAARSPEVAGPGPAEEQFYEEYLDELDGIPWIV